MMMRSNCVVGLMLMSLGTMKGEGGGKGGDEVEEEGGSEVRRGGGGGVYFCYLAHLFLKIKNIF